MRLGPSRNDFGGGGESPGGWAPQGGGVGGTPRPPGGTALPETAPVNLVWQQYVSKHGEKVAEEETALELARRFAEAGQSLDLVRIEQVSDAPPVSGEEGQLGFDVASHGWYSLLSWGLSW